MHSSNPYLHSQLWNTQHTTHTLPHSCFLPPSLSLTHTHSHTHTLTHTDVTTKILPHSVSLLSFTQTHAHSLTHTHKHTLQTHFLTLVSSLLLTHTHTHTYKHTYSLFPVCSHLHLVSIAWSCINIRLTEWGRGSIPLFLLLKKSFFIFAYHSCFRINNNNQKTLSFY